MGGDAEEEADDPRGDSALILDDGSDLLVAPGTLDAGGRGLVEGVRVEVSSSFLLPFVGHV